MSDLVVFGKNEQLSRATITLPKYGDLTEAKVVREMQVLFKGFDFDPDMNVEQMFKSIEAVETYAKNAAAELEATDAKFKMNSIMNNGAISAKRWHFGWIVNKCLKASSYGDKVAEKLAQSAGISVPYLYQYAAVGANLKLTDAYLLGMYNAGWENIRGIGAIKDRALVQSLIQYYVSSINDLNNSVQVEQVKAQLKAALARIKEAPEALDMSTPKQIEEVVEIDKDAPEYVECLNQLERLKTSLRALSVEKKIDPIRKACGDCYLVSTVPSAADRLGVLHTSAQEAEDLLVAAQNFLSEIRVELQSLQHMQLLDPDA